MKRIASALIGTVFFIALAGCQESPNNSDSAKLQDSIDKIKTKIQEDLSSDKSEKSEKADASKEKSDENKQ